MSNQEVGLSAIIALCLAAAFSVFVYGCTEVQKSNNEVWAKAAGLCIEHGGQLVPGGNTYTCVSGSK